MIALTMSFFCITVILEHCRNSLFVTVLTFYDDDDESTLSSRWIDIGIWRLMGPSSDTLDEGMRGIEASSSSSTIRPRRLLVEMDVNCSVGIDWGFVSLRCY